MDQEQQSRWRYTTRQVLWTVGIVVALGVGISLLGGYLFGWEYTGLIKGAGFPKRTLWDWLQVLLI